MSTIQIHFRADWGKSVQNVTFVTAMSLVFIMTTPIIRPIFIVIEIIILIFLRRL